MRRKDCRESSTFVCVHERERERGGGRAGTRASSPMLALQLGLEEGCALVLDLVMGWVFISIKTESFYVPTL